MREMFGDRELIWTIYSQDSTCHLKTSRDALLAIVTKREASIRSVIRFRVSVPVNPRIRALVSKYTDYIIEVNLLTLKLFISERRLWTNWIAILIANSILSLVETFVCIDVFVYVTIVTYSNICFYCVHDLL